MFLSVSNIKSSSVAELSVNAATKQAVVRYIGSDRPYLYTGVDFNALYNIVFTQVDSIGQWVNQNLKNVANVECYAVWLDRTEILFNGGIRVPLFITLFYLISCSKKSIGSATLSPLVSLRLYLVRLKMSSHRLSCWLIMPAQLWSLRLSRWHQLRRTQNDYLPRTLVLFFLACNSNVSRRVL